MSKKKLLIAAAILIAGGTAIAVSAPGHRGHGMGGGMIDRWFQDEGRHGLGMGRFAGRWGGELTREAFDEKVRERFARFDLNSDGVIDVAEIEAALTKSGKHRGFRERRADREGDAKREIRRGRSVTKSEYLDEVRRRFALVDLDSDGRITDADLPPTTRGRDVLSRFSSEQSPAMRDHRHGYGRGLRLGFLRGANVDQDGGISLDEAIRVAGERFDRMDRNKDGTLDRADREVFAKEMTDYRVKRVLHRLGATAEGKITREQAFKVAGEMFDRLDRNKDGKISRDERPRGWHRDRGHHDERYRRGRDRDRGEERAPDREQKKI
jgi:Ca2+-binding EF-hand superfamily protein